MRVIFLQLDRFVTGFPLDFIDDKDRGFTGSLHSLTGLGP